MTDKPIKVFKITFSSPLIVPSLHGHFPDGWRIMVHDPIDIAPGEARCVTANKDTLIVKIFTDAFAKFGITNKSLLTLDLKSKPKNGDTVVFGAQEDLQIGRYETTQAPRIYNFITRQFHNVERYALLGVVIKVVGFSK